MLGLKFRVRLMVLRLTIRLMSCLGFMLRVYDYTYWVGLRAKVRHDEMIKINEFLNVKIVSQASYWFNTWSLCWRRR